ncbi:unnamed protein product [Heligmosomoides polygyrus]|uniref:Uncharacterized protein n=1 Tax=Heligmosomoides polygyrus TaxID=6339 RepID=A0A183F355_HELPZ|nr:unnamed protein product [Heligmosomoides polygyrus]
MHKLGIEMAVEFELEFLWVHPHELVAAVWVQRCQVGLENLEPGLHKGHMSSFMYSLPPVNEVTRSSMSAASLLVPSSMKICE